MQAELAQCHRKVDRLSKDAAIRSSGISVRAETTYLNIIGAMLELMLTGQSPSGIRYSPFNTQDAVVSALTVHYGDRVGISERTLNGKFSKARKALPSRVI